MRDAKAARDAETDFKNVFLAGKNWGLPVYGKTCTSTGARKEFKEFILVRSKKEEEAMMKYYTHLRGMYGPVEKTETQKVVDQLLSEKEKEKVEREKLEMKLEHVQVLASKDLNAAKEIAQKEIEIARKEIESGHREMQRMTEHIEMLRGMCDKLLAATRS